MNLSPNSRVWLAALSAATGVFVAYRYRDDVKSQVALVASFGVAQWLLATAHKDSYG